MKNILFLLIVLSSLHKVHAHEYFFAFAEVEYNMESKRFEGTIIVTTHDLEMAMLKDGIGLPALETLHKEDSSYIQLSNYVFDDFKIKVGDSYLNLSLIGIEVFMVGTSNLYFESEEILLTKDCEFTFDLLMDEFSEQQNKMSFLYNDTTYTLHFLQEKRTQTFKLENKNNG